AWGAPGIDRIAWRLAGNPVDRLDAGPAPRGDLRPAVDRLRAALTGSARIYEPPHAHARFRSIGEALHWSRRRALMRGAPIPARVRSPTGELAMRAALVGRSFAEIPAPLRPWLELALAGYALWAITRTPTGTVLELAAPFPPPRTLTPARKPAHPSKQQRIDRELPRAVWSVSLSELRLACARGDAGAVRRELPLLAKDDEPGQPRLIHFAAYGGPEVLAALAEYGHATLV